MTRPGIEPGAFSVLRRCDNRYTSKSSVANATAKKQGSKCDFESDAAKGFKLTSVRRTETIMLCKYPILVSPQISYPIPNQIPSHYRCHLALSSWYSNSCSTSPST